MRSQNLGYFNFNFIVKKCFQNVATHPYLNLLTNNKLLKFLNKTKFLYLINSIFIRFFGTLWQRSINSKSNKLRSRKCIFVLLTPLKKISYIKNPAKPRLQMILWATIHNINYWNWQFRCNQTTLSSRGLFQWQ